MLCPKCDYISFDHLTNCAKCNHDLAEIASLLNGTSVISVQVNYLGIADEITAGDDAENIFATDTELVDGEGLDSGADYSDSFAEQEDLVELSDEESLALEPDTEVNLSEDEATGLELKLEGHDTGDNSRPEIDFTMPPVLNLDAFQTSESGAESNRESSSDDAGDEPETEAANSAGIVMGETDEVGEQQTPLPELHLEAESGSDAADEEYEDQPQASALADEQMEDFTELEGIHSADLGIEDSALTLEVDDDDQGSGLTFEGDQDGVEIESAGATGIDLGNIDLSDLVYALDPDSQGDMEADGDKPAAGVIKSCVPDNELSLKLESDIEPQISEADTDPGGQGTDGNYELGDLGMLSLENDNGDTSDSVGRPLDFEGGADNLVDASALDDPFDSLDISVDSADDDGMELDLEIDDDK
nr:hypothetical protein [Desulfobulbaceae bacterium]